MYDVDFENLKRLEEKMQQLPNRMESSLNKVIHIEGSRLIKDDITRLLPLSKVPNKLIHAKSVTWAHAKRENLGIIVKTKGGAANKAGSFGYLVFPNEGIGRSNPREQQFMERGLAVATPKLITKLLIKADKTIQEVL